MTDRVRALELFLSLQSTGSFSETGRAFRISSTSVSRAISLLEDRIGQSLLTRSTRNVRLTEIGEEYAVKAAEILEKLNSLEDSVSALRARPAGLLRVHTRSMFGIGLLTPLLPDFAEAFPEISVELVVSEEPIDLRREKIDIDFRLAEPDEPGLKRRKIYSATRYLVAAPSALVQRGTPQRPEDLHAFGCLAYYSSRSQAHWWINHPEGNREKFSFTPRFASNNGAVLLDLARRGAGAAVLHDYIVQKDIEDGTLVRLLTDYDVSSTGAPAGLYVAILDSMTTPAKIRVFVDFVADRLAGREKRFQVSNTWEKTRP